MPARAPNKALRWLRVTLLLLPVLIGVALVGGAYSNRARTHEASELLVQGQAESILRSIGRSLRTADSAPDAALLNEMLDELRDEGVHYLALVAPDGTATHAAGLASAPNRLPATVGNSIQIVRSENSIRVGARFPFGRFRRRPPRMQSFDARGLGPSVVFEFEPALANRLRQDADRTFTLSIISTAFLSMVAVGLWWQLRRRERQAQSLEREQRLAQLGEMSAVLAHEIRNPLASLKGQAQLLLEQLPEGGRESKKAQRIVAESLRLEKLSATLLDFVRSGTVDRQPVDVMGLVQQAVDSTAPNRVNISTQGDLERKVMLDPLRMQQVLENLLQNAVQASTADQQIDVMLSLTAHHLRISIRDHGPGLPPGSEAKIFDAFQTDKPHGTGLGLAVARRIVELHRGTLIARHHPEGGAFFTLDIPS